MLNQIKIRKLLTRFLAFLIILFLFFVFLNLYIFWTSSICDSEYMASYLDKLELIEHTDSPRLIFVGDSNLAFTLDSQLIDDAFDYHPIDMSMSINTGLRYDLSFIRPHLRSGDVVVISAIFPQLTVNSRYFNSDVRNTHLWGLMVMKPDHIQYLTSWDQVLYIIISNWREVIKRLSKLKILSSDCIYLHDKELSRYDFNEYGDYLGNLDWEDQHRNFNDEQVETSELDPEATQFINEFAAYAQSQGVTVLYSYPAYAEGFWLTSQDKILELHEAMQRDYDFPIIGQPSDYYLSNDMLSNTAYHGNREGREKRTEQVIKDLQAYFDSQEN